MTALTSQPTWEVQDSSKIQDYMACPRRYFYNHVLGWRSEQPNVHLEFGTAWHLAMEVLLREGYTPEAVARAFDVFLSHYRRFFPPEMDDANGAKTPTNALRALCQYIKAYPRDLSDFSVLHIEVSGSVPVSEKRLLYFKTDTICRGHEGFFSLEHKTGSRFSTMWAASWRQKVQIGTYLHVLHSLYPSEEVYGVKINGVFPHSEPKRKKDGELYAGATDTEFHRVIVRRTPDSMQSWLTEINIWLDLIEDDFQRMSAATAGDQVFAAFPRNTENCTQYGICPFHDYCSIWHNPLQHADAPPIGFTCEFWDPRSPEYVKEYMSL